MTYEDFKEHVLSHIKEYLDPGEDYFVSLGTVYKNNTALDGLRIMPQGNDTNISPNIYLNGIYEEFTNNPGAEIEDVLRQIAWTYNEHRKDNDRVDVSSLMDFDTVKDQIFCKIIGMDGNEEMLKDKPFRQIEDMAVLYYVDVSQLIPMGGKATVTITNEMMDTYGITLEQLDFLAIKNQSEKLEPSCCGLGSVISSLLAGDETGLFMDPDDYDVQQGAMQMFVLTNKDRLQGASVILDSNFMDSLTDKVGEVYILPSSVHECLAVPKKCANDYFELECMVKEVNSTTVSPEDKLTDHVYCYDPKVKEIYRADKEEEHRQHVEAMDETMGGRKAAGR